jgi:uncharacterized protein (TIGR02172 family)
MNLDRVIAVRNRKTVFRDGDMCVKVFNNNYTKADVLNEALNQARIEETGLHIPRILEVTTVEGKWAIVSEYIKGKTLAQLMQENPEDFEKYLTIFVDLQLEMHSKTCPMLNKLKDKMNRKISQTELDATTRYDLHTRLESMPKHNKVCHGDFNPSNIIIAEDGTPYILDWSHATQGDAAADAARTYLLFCLHGSSENAQKYLDLFCRQSNADSRHVRRWLPLVAASQSIKGNAEERGSLLAWMNDVNHQ